MNQSSVDEFYQLDTVFELQKKALNEASIVAVTDAKGVITYVNDNFCRISQFSREDLLGKTHNIVNSGYHDKKFFGHMWRAIAAGKVWRGEICNRKKDGSVYWVDTTIVPFVDKEGRPHHYVAIRNDITDKKNAIEMLEDERKRLVQSEKMASLGIMAAGIAHEIGNPLAALRGRLEMFEMTLSNENLDFAKAKKTVKIGLELVDRINRIVKGLKAYARDGSKDPFEWVDLGDLVGDILELTHDKSSKRGIKVIFDKPSGDTKVQCRESEIGQVLVNLINNSFDAIRDLANPWIQVEVIAQESRVSIGLTDCGLGISEAVQKHMFDPFFTTKPVGQGTGLGLSICNRIVDSHGGVFEYDSHHENTKFWIHLPRNQEAGQ